MISISKKANLNYLAKIVYINNIEKHPNADRLQVTKVDFQNVILGLDAKPGDIYVFFPLECQINDKFLSFTNAYRDKELNKDKTKQGFFESNGRVRAVKLRGEKSMGYVVPIKELENFVGEELSSFVGQEFDTIKNVQLVRKYYVKEPSADLGGKQGKKPKISRLVEGQVKLHVDTENFRKNAFKIVPSDVISISYKVHGTSFWTSHVLVKRKLNIVERGLKSLGVTIQDKEYGIVYGSRRTVKAETETSEKQHYYKYDLWAEIKNDLCEFIPKGYTLYGECCGYTKDGGMIQKDYDYGCEKGKYRLFIYRITFTNEDGLSNELSTTQIAQFCDHYNLQTVPTFYVGQARYLFKDLTVDKNWTENFVKRLEERYTEKDCVLCNNNVPEEGIVIRKESMFNFEAYKLKSFNFLLNESEQLDKGLENLEDKQ